MTNATATKGDLQSSPISECVTTRNTSPLDRFKSFLIQRSKYTTLLSTTSDTHGCQLQTAAAAAAYASRVLAARVLAV